MTAPLDGVTVLDLTRNLAGPYATMVLGDLGARVIKVERPGTGDDTRHWTPPTWGGHSALFLALNRNKESVALDTDDPADVARIRDLAARVDVVVESDRTGSPERRGLGFEDLRAVNPTIVYCSISGFGSRGPDRDRPGYDTIVQAASGVMSINGEPGGTPARVGPALGLVRDWEHPDVEGMRLVDHPVSYNGVRSFRHDLPPALGEHTDRVLAELDPGDTSAAGT